MQQIHQRCKQGISHDHLRKFRSQSVLFLGANQLVLACGSLDLKKRKEKHRMTWTWTKRVEWEEHASRLDVLKMEPEKVVLDGLWLYVTPHVEAFWIWMDLIHGFLTRWISKKRKWSKMIGGASSVWPRLSSAPLLRGSSAWLVFREVSAEPSNSLRMMRP